MLHSQNGEHKAQQGSRRSEAGRVRDLDGAARDATSPADNHHKFGATTKVWSFESDGHGCAGGASGQRLRLCRGLSEEKTHFSETPFGRSCWGVRQVLAVL